MKNALRKKPIDTYYYDERFNTAEEHISKKKKEINNKKKDGPKSEGKKEEEAKEEEEDGPLVICDGTDEEACVCDAAEKEVTCVNVMFDDNTFLDTLDVALPTDNDELKDFKPISARFADNLITTIRRGQLPEGMEDQFQGQLPEGMEDQFQGQLPEGMEESLAFLHLERNRISNIDNKAFEVFKNLSTLSLEKNRLKTIRSSWFIGDIATTLKHLNLADNFIKTTDKSPFAQLKNLKKLILDGNKIELNEDFFVGLGNLETLSMDNCNIGSFPESIFEPLKSLKKLSLRNNPFNEVPTVLADVPHLLGLDLSMTSIVELHRESFIEDLQLVMLYMTEMPMLATVQECAFCGLKSLKVIDFYNSSRLSFIDENAFGFKEYDDNRAISVTDLRLARTNISKLSLSLLEFDTLEKLDLSGAPLNCTCDQLFLRNIDLASDQPHNGRCAFPEAMRGKYIEQAQIRELCGIRFARGFRFAFALMGALSSIVFILLGYVLYKKGYRFTNIRHLPMPSLPGSTHTAYTNLSRQEEREMQERNHEESRDPSTLDFIPRPADV